MTLDYVMQTYAICFLFLLIYLFLAFTEKKLPISTYLTYIGWNLFNKMNEMRVFLFAHYEITDIRTCWISQPKIQKMFILLIWQDALFMNLVWDIKFLGYRKSFILGIKDIP